MLETITHLVTNFGYIIVAVFILLECAGFPVPGETALLVAAGFAGAGKLSISVVIIIAASAAILGDAGGYWLGRLLGRGFVERFGRYVGLSEKKMKILEGFFVRHGAVTVFFGRFVGVLRTYSALFAGISRMPYVTFTIFNAMGGIVWALIFGLIGYLFGQNLDEVEHLVRVFGWGALLGLAIIGAVWYLRRWVYSTAGAEGAVYNTGVRHTLRRLLYGSSIISMRTGSPRLSRLAVTVFFAVGFIITVCLVVFVSLTTHGLADYDPLMRFEETLAAGIDNWLTQRQSLLLLSVATYGSGLSVALGIVSAAVSFALKKRLYMFVMLFAITGGEILNALLAFLNRESSVFISTHISQTAGYLLALDNTIVPVIVFGMLAYFSVLATIQLAMEISIIVGLSLPPLAILASSFLSGVHGPIEFIEKLLGAVVWLWICIALMEIIRHRRNL
jgi:membrane protein DedA with SNARE-associated domain